MKITRYRKDGRRMVVTTLTIEAALRLIATETKNKRVTELRHTIGYEVPGQRCRMADLLPVLVFAGVFSRKDPHLLEVYNGIVLLEINKLADREEVLRVKKMVADQPQTYAAFTGSGGKSVKILVRFSLPDGTLPRQREQINLFHAEAYRRAVKWYGPQLNREIELKEPLPERGCRLTYDPRVYFKPDAAVIRMEQPLRPVEEKSFKEEIDSSEVALNRLLPGHARSEIIGRLYNAAYRAALKKLNGAEPWEEMQIFLTALAHNCRVSEVPEEDAVKWAIYEYGFKGFEGYIRDCFRTVYEQKRKPGNQPALPASMTLMATLEEFMRRRYRFRRNVIKGVTEYNEVKSFGFTFRPVNKRAMNSICMDAHGEGLAVWDADIRRYVESNRIASFNPVEDYLNPDNLPEWDGKDYIREMAGRIPCDNPQWKNLFYIWFLSMVAHWQHIDKSHANSALPLLVGDQGCGKSTFCLNLLPPPLREYYTDSLDFSKRREVELALGRFLLINMDEFDSISPSYQGFMKHIIQKAVVQTRVPYGAATEQIKRYATFIATSNNFDLLSDPTGSRRFICIEVKGVIDYGQPVNYEQLYAQAVTLLSRGERYWFTREEEAYITKANQAFRQLTLEAEMAFRLFRKPEAGEEFLELTCGEVFRKIIAINPGLKYRHSIAVRLGKELRAVFDSRKTRQGIVYQLVER